LAGLKNLQALDLSHTQVTGAGFKGLAGLKSSQGTHRVRRAFCRVKTSKGAHRLEPADLGADVDAPLATDTETFGLGQFMMDRSSRQVLGQPPTPMRSAGLLGRRLRAGRRLGLVLLGRHALVVDGLLLVGEEFSEQELLIGMETLGPRPNSRRSKRWIRCCLARERGDSLYRLMPKGFCCEQYLALVVDFARLDHLNCCGFNGSSIPTETIQQFPFRAPAGKDSLQYLRAHDA
jgi:hypothetical protein